MFSIGIWATSRRVEHCTTIGCESTIPAGAIFRRVGLSAVCAFCAKQRFHVEPDGPLPRPTSAAAFRMRLAGFVPAGEMAKDWRQRQLPREREPGEDG